MRNSSGGEGTREAEGIEVAGRIVEVGLTGMGLGARVADTGVGAVVGVDCGERLPQATNKVVINTLQGNRRGENFVVIVKPPFRIIH